MRQGEPRGTGSSRGGTAAAQKTSEEDREPPLSSTDLAPLLNEGGEDRRPQATAAAPAQPATVPPEIKGNDRDSSRGPGLGQTSPAEWKR